MHTPKPTMPLRAEGSAFGAAHLDRINTPGNVLIHFPVGYYSVFTANGDLVAAGPQLASLWEKGVKQQGDIVPLSPHEKLMVLKSKTWHKLTPSPTKKCFRPVKQLVPKTTHRQSPTIDTDSFLRALGATAPVEERKTGPELIFCYMDPQFRFDRMFPFGIATKVS